MKISTLFPCLAFCRVFPINNSELLSVWLYIYLSPQKYLYILDLYALFNKFVRGILCSKVVFQRTNSVPFLNAIFPHHYKNLSEIILSTE